MEEKARGEMFSVKSFVALSMSILISLFPIAGAYSQEGVMPSVGVKEGAAPIEEKPSYVKPGNVTMNFKGADIRAVLRYLSEVSGVDIVPSPDVEGSVTLALTDKPWDVALDLIVKNYGYAYEREGDIIRVVTVDSLTQAELSTEILHLNYCTAESVEESVKDMLTDRGKLTYDSRTNTLLITDLPTNIYKIKQVVERLDRRTPQVMIEARIFETLLEKDEKMGIDWSIKIAALGARRPTTLPFGNEIWRDLMPDALRGFYPRGQAGEAAITYEGGDTTSSDTLSAFPAEGIGGTRLFPLVGADAFTFGTLDFTQFSAVLELLKQRNRTEVISNPRITTLNHKEAKILVGQVYNFPTFDLSPETGRWIITGYEAQELGVRLTVVPHVNTKGEVVVELKPEISQFQGMQDISDELKAPLWATREAETEIMVKDRETIFIGGLIKENNIELEKKVPLLGDLLGDIPVIGGAFKHKMQDKEKTELVFFITVYIVKDFNSLRKIATRNLSDTKLPDDLLTEAAESASEGNEVFVELPMAGQKSVVRKGARPVFDFRKKK